MRDRPSRRDTAPTSDAIRDARESLLRFWSLREPWETVRQRIADDRELMRIVACASAENLAQNQTSRVLFAAMAYLAAKHRFALPRDTGWSSFSALRRSLLKHATELRVLLQRSAQINDPLRCAALYPGLLFAAACVRRRLALVEVGPSLGLNLCMRIGALNGLSAPTAVAHKSHFGKAAGRARRRIGLHTPRRREFHRVRRADRRLGSRRRSTARCPHLRARARQRSAESKQRRLRRSSRPERRPRCLLLSLFTPLRKDPLDELRLLDTRNHFQPPAAAHALLDLDPEHALQAPCPVHTHVFGCRPGTRAARRAMKSTRGLATPPAAADRFAETRAAWCRRRTRRRARACAGEH